MGKKRGEDAEDLNLVPIMNLVTILIPFLLMAAQFVSYAVIDSTLPAIGPPQESSEEEKDEEEPLSLSVFITSEGYEVSGNHPLLKKEGEGEGEEKGATIPCLTPNCDYSPQSQGGAGPESAYDVRQLRDLLGKLKDDHEDEQNVILVPEAGVPYEILVVTMDATREDPDAGGEASAGDVSCNGRCLFPFVVIAGGVTVGG